MIGLQIFKKMADNKYRILVKKEGSQLRITATSIHDHSKSSSTLADVNTWDDFERSVEKVMIALQERLRNE